MSTSNELPESVRTSWTDFLETYEPLRADLYRYCRHLARSPWDAEDLAQDTMARAFVTLGQMGQSPPNPRAWLFRVVGATTQYGPEDARRTVLYGMLFGVRQMLGGDPVCNVDFDRFRGVIDVLPRVEARPHRGAWVLLHWYAHEDGDAVRALTRVEVDGDRIAHLSNYFYNPELVAEVCAELAVPAHSNGRRWWPRREA